MSEGEIIECKFCDKYFDSLDMILGHVMVDHEEHFSKNVEKSNGIYLTAGFLFKNGFVDEVFNDECEADERVNKNISECYDDIDSEDDFDVKSDNFK